MNTKIVIALISMVAIALAAVPPSPAAPAPPEVNPWIPPWVSSAPWYPQWGPCSIVGASCQDCSTKLICTKIGGLQKMCADPEMPYCNLGECSATPSAECAPVESTATV